MEIILYNNISEKNKIGKDITLVATLTGSIKDPSSLIRPKIVIEYSDPTAFNYVYISEFGRYYYVGDITILNTNILMISLIVDVLESFKTSILSQHVIIDKNQNVFSNYLPDDNLVTLVKSKTDIVNFPSGLLDDGEFILITAGGIPTI